LADAIATTGGFCRECSTSITAATHRCISCGSPRIAHHPELHQLTIAHIDCDAFYAAVEKRDRPELRDVPVIIGGARRGVVSTACYIARIKGVKSAMPMFKALKLCPEATVIKPDMKKYAEVSKQVSALMQALTPSVEHISIDEAFLDMTGTERLHGASAAITLNRFQHRLEKEIGISASVGLSHNKFLAKIASDLSKPRGFSVIGRVETLSFLAKQPVGLIWGVGKAMQATLEKDGITQVAQLQTMDRNDLMRRYGSMGLRLYSLSRGEDQRVVSNEGESKSIGSETTFDDDISDSGALEAILWQQCERVAKRAKAHELEGTTVTLKLKTPDFKLLTRSASSDEPTSLAHRIFEIAVPLLKKEANGRAFRLLGVSISNLSETGGQLLHHSLDQHQVVRDKAELAMDKIRSKLGDQSVIRGISLKGNHGRKR
jgi:DNA polymerase IV